MAAVINCQNSNHAMRITIRPSAIFVMILIVYACRACHLIVNSPRPPRRLRAASLSLKETCLRDRTGLTWSICNVVPELLSLLKPHSGDQLVVVRLKPVVNDDPITWRILRLAAWPPRWPIRPVATLHHRRRQASQPQ
jgi:hypothetical protein